MTEPVDRREISLLLDKILRDAAKRYRSAESDASRRSWAKQCAGLGRVRRDLLRDREGEDLEKRLKTIEAFVAKTEESRNAPKERPPRGWGRRSMRFDEGRTRT
jgi:hypothetical protein